jgi:hypothetical protein
MIGVFQSKFGEPLCTKNSNTSTPKTGWFLLLSKIHLSKVFFCWNHFFVILPSLCMAVGANFNIYFGQCTEVDSFIGWYTKLCLCFFKFCCIAFDKIFEFQLLILFEMWNSMWLLYWSELISKLHLGYGYLACKLFFFFFLNCYELWSVFFP